MGLPDGLASFTAGCGDLLRHADKSSRTGVELVDGSVNQARMVSLDNKNTCCRDKGVFVGNGCGVRSPGLADVKEEKINLQLFETADAKGPFVKRRGLSPHRSKEIVSSISVIGIGDGIHVGYIERCPLNGDELIVDF